MPGFDVLQKDLPLFENHFIEASAGTGKTFCIEHLILRALLSGLSIDEILIVTFTKKAVLELKRRVRVRLEKTLHSMEERKELPSFLQESTEKELYLAKKRILRALSLFDEAKIMTIHSFCYQRLNPLQENGEEEGVNKMVQIAKDFLRQKELLPPYAWEILLKSFKNDLQALAKRLVELASTSSSIHKEPEMDLHSALTKVREEAQLQDRLEEELIQAAPLFQGLCDRKGEIKQEVLEEIREASLALFQGSEDLISYRFLLHYHEENRVRKKKEVNPLILTLQKELIEPLGWALDERALLLQLLEKFSPYFERAALHENALFYELALRKMERRVQEKEFREEIQNEIKMCLIDEFQDTDRVQWNIFSTLFLERGTLYVVGDPKQSIYSFRGADIYTYTQAKHAFTRVSSLQCNYRSTPELISSLNALFSPLDPFMTIRSNGEKIVAPPLQAPQEAKEIHFKDGKKSLHFWSFPDEEALFEAIVEEILALHEEEKIPFSSCAVLVKDRYQLERFVKASAHRLKVSMSKKRALLDTPAYEGWMALLAQIEEPKDQHTLLKLLQGAPFFYAFEEMEEEKKRWSLEVMELKEIYEKKGILALFRTLFEKKGVLNRLLQKEGGKEIYGDFLCLLELAVEKALPKEELLFLKRLKEREEELESYSFSQEAVHVMTIHMSKGLEFDLVFPVGLLTSSPFRKELYFDFDKNQYGYGKEIERKKREESEMEKMRLLYVACTRAKKRLYIPLIEKKEEEAPLTLFLERRFGTLPELEYVHEIEGSTHSSEKRVEPHHISLDPPSLIIPKEPHFSFTPSYFTSYTQMASLKKERTYTSFGGEGREFGVALHAILAALPLQRASRMEPLELKELLLPHAQRWELDIDQILPLFTSTLQARLGTFSFAEIEENKMVKEQEFYFPKGEDIVRGSIDLIFEHQGKVYFIDWKSNSLPDYGQESLQRVMEESGYGLQCALYKEALLNYLSLFGKKEEFGGAYYLFLRGTKAKTDHGVYHVL